jgi:hypothetical protein
VALAVLAVAGQFVIGVQIHQLRNELEAGTERSMSSVTTTWKSNGLTVAVTTPKRDGETAAQWAARHKEDVEAMLVAFPKDPQ